MFFSQLYNSSTPLIWTFAGILFLSFIVQMIYYLLIFSKVPRYQAKKIKRKKIGVSVIICAKNEAENLSNFLPAFLHQDYPEYEVVVVNDCSTDHSEDVLMELKVKYPHLRYTSIYEDKKFTHGKKLAVTVGIKAATYENLLFSDADCYPISKDWISRMSRHFSKETELIIGVGKYEQKKGILNSIIRYETLFTAIQYLSFAIKGSAFMGVGRNLAYKRELFFRHKGFASHLKVLSGDDDLFVNEASNRRNTAVEFSPQSFTMSIPPSSFSEWFKQKKRHLSTGKFYKTSSKFNLGLEYFSRMLFYASFTSILFFENWIWIGIGLWFIRMICKAVIVKLTMNRLKERDLLVYSLLLDFLLPFILLIIRISNIIRPREPKWN